MEMEDHQTPWKGRRSTTTTWEGGALGGEEEGVRASLLCDFTIMFNRSWPSLKGKKPWGGSAATIALQCVVNAWRALVAGLEGGGQGEVFELGREGRGRHP